MNTDNQLLKGGRDYFGEMFQKLTAADLGTELRMWSNQRLVSTCEGPVHVLETGL